MKKSIYVLLILIAGVLVACGTDATSTATTAPTTAPVESNTGPTTAPDTSSAIVPASPIPADSSSTTTEVAIDPATGQVEGEQPAEAEAVAPAPVEYNGPGWTSLPLVDARSGETFTFADFAGRTVYVHMMATWCTICRGSQRTLASSVVPELSSDQYAFVSIDVQTGLTAGELASYSENNRFNWTFAVATTDLLRGMNDSLGSVTNPPSTPHFVIGPDGTLSQLMYGTGGPQETIDLLTGFGVG